ncbi:MAG TPA: hypothetical protein VMU81_27890 [Acetobacteraceae bacterium]|nr:hypothetical protein [Acetobacteraceae bacterium]
MSVPVDPIKLQLDALIDGWHADGLGRGQLIRNGDTYELYCDGEWLAAGRLPDLWEYASQLDSRARAQTPKAASPFNGASTKKSRGRPPDPCVAGRRKRLCQMAEQSQPATVRQLYYLAETEELVPKSDSGYRRVQHDLLLLRRDGAVPYDWISDNTRWMRKSRSYRGIEHFLDLTISTYRRDLWARAAVHVEIWCEKDALAGVIMEETDPYDVPLLVARGCSSETYLYDAAQAIAAKNKAAYIYHFGDHDPTGQVAAAHIERMLRSFAPDADIYFKSVAVTKEQITDWKLPTRPTKRDGNTHARNFTGDSCELDSIPPLKLRALVRECIEQHIDRELFAKLKAAEKSEREALTMFAKQWRAA